LVGELPKIRKKSDLLIGRNDRSVVAEAFRILITNMRYLQINLGDIKKGIIIFVTSTVKGEGKTFTCVNLAATFANNGKKVLIIGADLRNPKLETYKTEAWSIFRS
jgi:tyrosine-protein kinase Etk/Wzc